MQDSAAVAIVKYKSTICNIVDFCSKGIFRLEQPSSNYIDGMVEAWVDAISDYTEFSEGKVKLDKQILIHWAYLIDPESNKILEEEWRSSAVIGVDTLLKNLDDMTPQQAYEEFVSIQPFDYFVTRLVGKILFNWLNKSLLNPTLPKRSYI